MKIIDKNGRLFGKISIIDVAVLLVVAVMALGLYVKSTTKDITAATDNKVITYQISANAVPEYMADALVVGDQLFEDGNKATNGSLGTITDIQTTPGDRLAELSDGTLEMVPVEEAVNLLITVEGEGIADEDGYRLNRTYTLGVNSARNFATPYSQFTGTVTHIETEN